MVLGCSADGVEAQARFKAKQKINFSLLSDPDFSVIESYGARRMKSFLGKSFLGIVRSTYLIDRNGKIATLWEQVSPKGHAAQVLEAIAQLS